MFRKMGFVKIYLERRVLKKSLASIGSLNSFLPDSNLLRQKSESRVNFAKRVLQAKFFKKQTFFTP